MSDKSIGDVTWQDLTIENADGVSEFYAKVVGWDIVAHNMGGYNDYEMHAPDKGCVAGICHNREMNAKMPPQWLIYITVADVDQSAAECVALGGKVIDGPKSMGSQRVVVIQDPAGAVAALVSK